MRRIVSISFLFCLLLFLPGCPGIQYDYSAEKVKESNGATTWVFHGEYPPPLVLSSPSEFIMSVNAALTRIGMPGVKESVPEKASITGYRRDRSAYIWIHYPEGILTVRGRTAKGPFWGPELYDALWRITLVKRIESDKTGNE